MTGGCTAEDRTIIDLTGRELKVLKEFLTALKEERDAIISFSLEGVIMKNNRKEEILKKLEYLEKEKEKVTGAASSEAGMEENRVLCTLHRDMDATAKEVRIYMARNMKLLSFSMDHVRSTIERIIGFINKTTYGRKNGTMSFVVSRNV